MIKAINSDQPGWRLHYDDTELAASHVVVTVPQPQVASLLGDAHQLVAQIADVKMAPVLTLMAAVSGNVPFAASNTSSGPLGLITCECGKLDRPQNAWVAQGGIEFSMAYLEKDLPDIGALMVSLLCDCLDITPDRITHAAAHRWRYARASKPLGQPFVSLPNETLYLGWDWYAGPKIEAVFISGAAIVTDMLKLGLC